MFDIKSINELKSSAKEITKGYKKTLIISTLIYLILYVTHKLYGVFNPSSYLSILLIILAEIATIGLHYQIFNLSIGNKITIKDMLVDFYTIIKIICIEILMILISFIVLIPLWVLIIISLFSKSIIDIILYSILLVIVPFILLLYIAPYVYYIVIDNNDTSIINTFKYMIKLTIRNLFKIILFELSFIPLNLLGVLGLGIPFIWIIPYYLASKAQFYFDMKEDYAFKQNHD